MYPLTCVGGFAMPVKAGKMEVVGFMVTVDDKTADSRFAIVDDPAIKSSDNWGQLLSTLTNQKKILADYKGQGNVDTILGVLFDEPIKTRNGISIFTDNVLAGSVCVYVR